MSPTRPGKAPWIVLSLLLGLAVLSLAPQPAAPVSGGNAIALKAPAFVQVANAQEGTGAQDAPAAAPMGFPQDEAGISAYFKSDSPVNLADVRGVYRVIEVQTEDYIIGSVPVPDYAENQDAHVYVHRDGWFVAYYLSADPVGKVLDWRRYAQNRIATKLEAVLSVVGSAVGVSVTGTQFYDFRFPNANTMMLVADVQNGNGNDSFEINLPGGFIYYHRGWSFGVGTRCYYSGSSFYLDGVKLADLDCGWAAKEGTLSTSQLLPDQVHNFELRAGNQDVFGAVVLLYRVP